MTPGVAIRHLRSDAHVLDGTSTLVEHVRSVALAPSSAVAGDGRTVEVQIVRWDHPEQVSDDGRTWYTESYARGGLRVEPGTRVVIRNEHDPDELAALGLTAARPGVDTTRAGVVVGVLASSHVRSDGLYGAIRLVDNPDGHYIRSLIPEVLDRLSVEFEDQWRPIRHGQHVVRTDARLTGLVFTLNPQRGDARVLAIRSDTTTTTITEETTTVDEETTTEETPPDPAAPPPASAPPAPAPAQPAGPPPAATTTQTRSVPRPGPIPGGLNPADLESLRLLNEYPTFGHFVRAAARGTGDNRHMRALAAGAATVHRLARFRRAFENAAVADIGGLLPPTWLSEIIDLVRPNTPTVENWARRPLPESGLTVTQPKVGDRPTVAKQATEYTEPASNKVTVTPVSWTVETHGGGQGFSIQSILRSEPEYVDEVMRLYAVEAARDWNASVATGLLAAADDVNTSALDYVTPQGFPDLIVDAAALLLGGLGRPPEVVALSIPLWVELAKAKVIQTSLAVSEDNDVEDVATTTETSQHMFPDLGLMNVVGTIDIASATGQMRQISYYVEPAWGTSDKVAVIGVREAYRSMQSALGTLTADDPDTLSRQLAVYFFGAHGKADASGLVLVEEPGG